MPFIITRSSRGREIWIVRYSDGRFCIHINITIEWCCCRSIIPPIESSTSDNSTTPVNCLRLDIPRYRHPFIIGDEMISGSK